MVGERNLKLVSLIVPVYNVENYLQKAIDSASLQDYQNLEIILIDDGSTDQSGKICDLAAKKDNRIVVVHQKNKGLGPARNAGLEIAHGDYIAFLDSDDWMDTTMISELVDKLEAYQLDIVVCQLFYVDGKKADPVYINNMDKNDFRVYQTKDALKLLIDDYYVSSYAWNKLYRKTVFQNVTYPENKLPYEDIATTYKTFMNASLVGVYNKPLYYYYRRIGSIIHTDDEQKQLLSEYYKKKAILERQKNIENRFPELTEHVFNRSEAAVIYLYNEALLSPDNISKELKEKCLEESKRFLKSNINKIYENSFSSKKHKIRVMLLLYFPLLYKLTLKEMVKRRKNFS